MPRNLTDPSSLTLEQLKVVDLSTLRLIALSLDQLGVVAGRADLDGRAQALLATHPHPSIRLDLARNPFVNPDVQRSLSVDVDSDVRALLACNPSLDASLHPTLAGDRHEFVLSALAEREDLSPETQRRVLDSIARDPDEYLDARGRLAANPTLAPDLFPAMLADPDFWVRLLLAENPNLPLGDDLPVALMLMHERPKDHLESELEGFDPSACATLTSTWEGTLGELKQVLPSFAPEAAPA